MTQYWELRKLNAETSMSLGNTAIWNLPKNGYLSGILLKGSVSTVSGATNAIDNAVMVSRLSQVEVKGDGNVTVYDLPGTLMQAQNWWNNGHNPISAWREYASNTQLFKSFIPFGRRAYDFELGLDLSRFDATELKITNDMTSTNWASPSMNVYGLFWRGDEGAPPFRGYLKAELFREWTTVADQTKYLDLKDRNKLRRILFQAIPDKTSGAADTNWQNLMYDLKYMIKSGKETLFDESLNTLATMMHLASGYECVRSGTMYRPADDDYDFWMGDRLGGGVVPQSQTGSGASSVPSWNDDDENTVNVEVYEADIKVGYITRGWGPFMTTIFNHDIRGDMMDWLDLQANAEVELEVHTRNAASAADGTNRVALETLV